MKQFATSGLFPSIVLIIVITRKEVAAVLLSFGAQPGMRNGENETVMDIITNHPQHRRDDFVKLIKEYRGQKPRTPRVIIVFASIDHDCY